MKKALKIEIEGTDGAGKTTALKYFIEKLQATGSKVLETREVGSPLIPTNVKLRELVLDPKSDLSGQAMEFIFAAMRLENDRYYRSVEDKYDFIVSDRGWLSHLAYTDHNVSHEFTDRVYMDVVRKMTDLPDTVIYLSVNTDTALERRVSRGSGMDVIEMKGVEYQEKVRQSFQTHIENLTKYHPDVNVLVVDANQDIEGVRRQIDEIVEKITKA